MKRKNNSTIVSNFKIFSIIKSLPVLLVFFISFFSPNLKADSRVISNTLSSGQQLNLNQYIESSNKVYRFYLQGDGNLVFKNSQNNAVIWSSATNGQNGSKLIMQNDGNLVLYTSRNSPKWASGTVGSGFTPKLIINDNGTLQLYHNSTVKWQKGTGTTPTTYTLTVNSGSGAGNYVSGVSVSITANAAPSGKVFDKWVSNSGNPTIVNINATFTTLKMPANAAIVTATYKSNNSDVVDASTLNNKIMAGYQGWHMASGDGANVGWRHWSSSTPNANNISFDLWPDMREYDQNKLYNTGFVYANGSNAKLYSAYNYETVNLHVKWMKDYGIDGVFVQRFIGEAVSTSFRPVRDKVLQNIRQASEQYGRVFANMYDISGGNTTTLVNDIKNDWIHLVDDLKITESNRYIRHNGKPVLSIWGLGLRTEFSATQANEIVTWFTQTAPEKYRVALKLGVDDGWRTQSSTWQAIYNKAAVISPWSVGRYGDNSGADNFKNNKIIPDLANLNPKNIGYMPVVFPGFSWWNLQKHTSPLNKIPRKGGKFFWRQFYNAVGAGCKMVYVAMFDEVDEGTAIYKVAENNSQIPTTGTFVKMNQDGETIPSDWYLRLTNAATKMLRKEIGLTSTIPLSYSRYSDLNVETIPAKPELSQNYPNPFNPTTTIKFTLAEQGNVKLSVMNAKGETVKILASGNYQYGNHSFDFDGSGLNSGVYFYQLTTQEKTITKKMILIK